MPWFALDDQGSFHEKVLAAGNEAYGAWCRAGQWSSAKLTEGRIPRHVALAIGSLRIWQRLEKVGLCDPTGDDDFQIHDFLDYNPSAEQVMAKREARATAGRAGGKKRAARHKKNLVDREADGSSDPEDSEDGSSDDKCAESLDRAQAIASANAKQLLEQNEPGEGPEAKQNSTPRVRLPDPSIPSSAPTERATAEPSQPRSIARPRPGPAIPGPLGGQAQLGLAGCEAIAVPADASPQKATDAAPVSAPAENPTAVAWRTWRAAYESKYRRKYPKHTADGGTMKRLAASGLDFLADLGRPPEDLERLMVHRWRRYLADPGQIKAGGKGFLQENAHALQYFERGVATYGSPWDAGAQSSAPLATVRVLDHKQTPEQIKASYLASQSGAPG